MDIYSYVAANNPYQAKAILHKWGYSMTNVRTTDDLGICLKKLVHAEGQDAFMDIVNSHPDKALIAEVYQMQSKENNPDNYKNCSGDSCACKNKEYLSFDASKDRPSAIAAQTNVFILAAALILAAAIIVKK